MFKKGKTYRHVSTHASCDIHILAIYPVDKIRFRLKYALISRASGTVISPVERCYFKFIDAHSFEWKELA